MITGGAPSSSSLLSSARPPCGRGTNEQAQSRAKSCVNLAVDTPAPRTPRQPRHTRGSSIRNAACRKGRAHKKVLRTKDKAQSGLALAAYPEPTALRWPGGDGSLAARDPGRSLYGPLRGRGEKRLEDKSGWRAKTCLRSRHPAGVNSVTQVPALCWVPARPADQICSLSSRSLRSSWWGM